MGILEQGCTCESCLAITKKNLKEARDKWDSGERDIIFKPYHYTCGDGCCDNYGTNMFVNGFQVTGDGENVESVLMSMMEFLNIENVIIDTEYEEED